MEQGDIHANAIGTSSGNIYALTIACSKEKQKKKWKNEEDQKIKGKGKRGLRIADEGTAFVCFQTDRGLFSSFKDRHYVKLFSY